MKEKLEYLKYILVIIVFVGLIAWASIIDPIVKSMKATGLPLLTVIIRGVIIVGIILTGLSIGYSVGHNERIKEPYRTLINIGIFFIGLFLVRFIQAHLL